LRHGWRRIGHSCSSGLWDRPHVCASLCSNDGASPRSNSCGVRGKRGRACAWWICRLRGEWCLGWCGIPLRCEACQLTNRRRNRRDNNSGFWKLRGLCGHRSIGCSWLRCDHRRCWLRRGARHRLRRQNGWHCQGLQRTRTPQWWRNRCETCPLCRGWIGLRRCLATDDRVLFRPWSVLGRFALGCVLIGPLLARLDGRIGIVWLQA